MSQDPILIEDDSGPDEDLKRAIALSLQDQGDEIHLQDQPHQLVPRVQTEPSFLGLNRAAMEAERLSRKRPRNERDISPPETRKRVHLSSEAQPTSSTVARGQAPSTHANHHPLRSSSTLKYPTGTILRTWAFRFERHRDIKLEEVLDKSNLRNAVLSSFQWDVEWVLNKIDTSRTNITFVMQAKEEEQRIRIRNDIADISNLDVCFPYMGGNVNCMHSKLMLLSYDSHLRVVVPSANLLPFDWGETGTMENSVFLIDLPRRAADDSTTLIETDFKKELVYFCKAMGLAQNLVNSLDNFDFTATSNIGFVHTIGGTHQGDDDPWQRTGYCGLAKAIRSLNVVGEQVRATQIDFVASSIGSLKAEFLATIYLAMLGDDGLTELSWRSRNMPARTFRGLSKPNLLKQVLAKFKVYFPSLGTVQQSVGGEPSGGTNCLSSKWWNGKEFPRANFKDCRSKRPRLLMHNKMIFARSTDALSPGWFYHGSANCSESAWGKLFQDSRTRAIRMNCRNWECGVVMGLDKSSSSAPQDLESLFAPLLCVPMEENTTPLADTDTGPWFFMG